MGKVIAVLVLTALVACGGAAERKAEPSPTVTPAADAPNAPAGAKAPWPDVLIVVVDTLRFDRTSLAPGGPPTTPALAALARGGTSYTQAISHAPWTLPATAALLTGEEAAGDRTTTLPGARTLFADMRDAGGRSVALSGNPLVTVDSGLLRGADVVEVAPAADVGEGPWLSGALVDRALRHAAAAEASAPLLLYLHLMDPHAPYARDRALFAPEQVGWSSAKSGPRTLPWSGAPATPQQSLCLDEQRRAYDGEVVATDAAIGTLLDRWPRQGPRIVVVTADHGEGLWSTARSDSHWLPDDPPSPDDPDHARWMECRTVLAEGYDEHGDQLTDEALRVPLILHGPGVPAGRVESRLVATADLAGTVRTLVGWPARGGTLPLTPEAPARTGVASVGPRGIGWTHPKGRLVRVDPRFAIDGQTQVHTAATDGPSEAEVERDLQLWMSAHPNPAPGPDLATQEKLRALGYTSGAAPSPP